MKIESKGKLAVLIAAGIWGFSAILLKLMYSKQGVFTIYFYSVAAVALASLFFWKRIDFKPKKDDIKNIMMIMLLGNANSLAIWFALKYTDVAMAEFLRYTMPVWAFIIAVSFLKEKVGKWRLTALLVSMIGIGFVFSPTILINGIDVKNIGNLLALLSALLYATQTSFIRKAKANPYTITFWNFLTSTLLIAPFYIFNNTIKNATDIIIIAVFGITMIFIPILLFYYGANKIQMTKSSIIVLFEVFVAVITAWLFLKESPALASIIGGLLIIISSALLIIKKK
jgi:drug/metabolite transporter (DMT)-like permease